MGGFTLAGSMSASEWKKYAQPFVDLGLQIANSSSSNGVLVGTLAWQGAENSVKAFLVSKSVVFPETHDFSRLLPLVSRAGMNSGDFRKLEVAIETVTCSGSYTDRKYPGADPGFWLGQPSAELLTRAKASKEAFDICCASIS